MADSENKSAPTPPPPAAGMMLTRAQIMGHVANVTASEAAGRRLYTLTMKDGTKFVGASQPGAAPDLAQRQAQGDAFDQVRKSEAWLRKSGLLPPTPTPEGTNT